MIGPLALSTPGPILSAVVVLAQDPLAGFNAATLGQYGVLGVVNFILFRFAHQAYNREKDRADKADAEVARLNQKIQDEYVGALKTANDALHESTSAIASVADKLPPRRRS